MESSLITRDKHGLKEVKHVSQHSLSLSFPLHLVFLILFYCSFRIKKSLKMGLSCSVNRVLRCKLSHILCSNYVHLM